MTKKERVAAAKAAQAEAAAHAAAVERRAVLEARRHAEAAWRAERAAAEAAEAAAFAPRAPAASYTGSGVAGGHHGGGGAALFPGQEALLAVLHALGCSGAASQCLLREDYDLDALMVSGVGDLVEIGVPPEDAEKLAAWVRG